MQHWVVVAALEIIEAGFYVANVAAVGQGVPEGDGAAAGVVDDLVAIGIEDARDRAPRVIGVLRRRRPAGIDQLHHITLQVQDIVIGGKAAAVVGGIIQGERQPLIIIDEIQNRCAAAAADRLPEYRICKHYSIFRILTQLAARCGGKHALIPEK